MCRFLGGTTAGAATAGVLHVAVCDRFTRFVIGRYCVAICCCHNRSVCRQRNSGTTASTSATKRFTLRAVMSSSFPLLLSSLSQVPSSTLPSLPFPFPSYSFPLPSNFLLSLHSFPFPPRASGVMAPVDDVRGITSEKNEIIMRFSACFCKQRPQLCVLGGINSLSLLTGHDRLALAEMRHEGTAFECCFF